MSTNPLLPALVIPDEGESSFISTPVLSQMLSSFGSSMSSSEDANSVTQASSEVASNHLSPNSSHLRLPIPTPSANHSQASFAFVDVTEEEAGGDFGDLPTEVAEADISIAPDGSFVETSSGQAARELKKRYDRIMGVSKDVRSPYAITAFTNQHGRQMFRVGHRGMNPPGKTAEQVEEEVERRATVQVDTSSYKPHQEPKKSINSTSGRRSPRRSRLSMNAFHPPSMYPVPITAPRAQEVLQPRPNYDGARSPPTRKLRKTRSNPQLSGGLPSSSGGLPPTSGHTGRGHSQSVTAADLPRYPMVAASIRAPPLVDIFANTMRWNSIPPSPAVSNTSFSSLGPGQMGDGSHSPVVFTDPFGPRVTFDSPSRPSDSYLSAPGLREMQSFESGLTARADTSPRGARSSIFSPSGLFSKNSPSTPPAETSPPTPSIAPPSPASRPGSVDRSYIPTVETLMHTRYSPEVFDVLQTYRGLPLLDRLAPDSTETTVIKMSLTADETAAPRDDPRFVIWGEVYPEPTDDSSVSISQPTDRSSSRSVASRRRSTKGRESPPDEPPNVEVSSPPLPEKILVAATIERWMAQLTSELNYDELLVFFMTYRTYITPVDLCHLLICRFHWALGQHTSEHDEMVRRIVRVRTFVAIRYWLLTFFEVDFIPSRELRLLLAGWLNALRKDPVLGKHHDATGIVRKLISVVRECKEVHTQRIRPPTGTTTRSTSPPSASPPARGHQLGELFGNSLNALPRKSWSSNDSDLDLDFIPEGESTMNGDSISNGDKLEHSAYSLLQQPLHKAIMEHRPSMSTTTPGVPFTASQTLPVHSNILSRAFVNTIGRLGRWKRINSRPAATTLLADNAEVSAFDLELTVRGDLLKVRGGVEQYLKMIENESRARAAIPSYQPPVPPPATAYIAAAAIPAPPSPPLSRTGEPAPNNSSEVDVPEAVDDDESITEASEESAKLVADLQPVHSSTSTPVQLSLQPTHRALSATSSSGSSSNYGERFVSRWHQQSVSSQSQSRGGPNSWGLDVVSIDDLDLSDASSETSNSPTMPPGLKKTPRRLPLRRDFEFVDRNRESVSSMGLTSRDSVTSASSASSSVRLGNTIQQWQVNAIVDSLSDDDETGDVEAALRRLEGHMNPHTQQVKASKVDNWVKTIRERLEAGAYGQEVPRYSSDGEELNDAERRSTAWGYDTDIVSPPESNSRRSSQASARLITTIPASPVQSPSADDATPVIAQGPRPPPANPEPRQDVEPPVPDEILKSRLTASIPPTPLSPQNSVRSGGSRQTNQGSSVLSPPRPRNPRVHRSWVHGYNSGELAEHFTLIDKELFLGVKFEELVGDDWVSVVDEANVLDWGVFLKERARWKAEGRDGYKTSALVAARARFNLMAYFVLSEIVLTHPAARPALVGKFIRIAWKCYTLNNFSTLVAIIAGLRSDWVSKVMRKLWNRVNVYNLRMLKDLTSFTSQENDFAHIRTAVAALADAKPSATEETSSSKGSTKGKETSRPGCIPFLGIYLSQLHRYSQLPDLVDPTAPTEAVNIDRTTNSFHAPAHPEVFATLAPLPSSMQLEPLINVHKQRLISGTIKSLVSGQHLASRVQLSVDKKLFQKCLKLRGLDTEMLARAEAMYPDV
ncbi:hypothetical protein OF83DRAFT_1141131 [Amylostereum chailletii]|nr:hypothetical protein OF83DRAFT_1141131 [Amylostereum chailletii]